MKKFILLIFLLISFSVFAQDGIAKAESEILRIFGNFIKFLFSFLILLASTLLIYLGISYISGRTQIGGETIHKAILFLVFGVILLITAFFIPNLIKSFIESSIK
jgi:hypothetical protein